MKQHEKKKWRKKFSFLYLGSIFSFMLIWMLEGIICLQAAHTAADMGAFPGVTVSPDQTAWTTDYLDTTNESLALGYTIQTGEVSALRELKKGEHYYEREAEGSIRIGQWKVAWPDAKCIHDIPYYQEFRGFPVSNTICEMYYNNGWQAYCADCGEAIGEMLFYAKSTTMQRITSIPAYSWYVYICPHCQGLEQGRDYNHICKDISYNYYEVVYETNNIAVSDSVVEGYMAPTVHMYNNAESYNGVSAASLGYDNAYLRKNSYVCEGYKFIGWNTSADGSGTFYEDGAKIWNLTAEEGGKVKLYAQWCEEKLNLFTRQMRLSDTEFVYQADDKMYYVKADGETVHNLLAEAYMEGMATQDFQIDRMTLYIGECNDVFPEWMKIGIPHGEVTQGSAIFKKESLSLVTTENFIHYLKPETIQAERRYHGFELAFEQQFTVPGVGFPFLIYPEAGAMLQNRMYTSMEEQDRVNGLMIIPDGTPPVINGLEELKDLDVLDMTEKNKIFELQAVDFGSGLGAFTVCVSNQDSSMQEKFVCDSEGKIILNINKENPLFMGEIIVSAVAVDRVGNINIIGESGLTFMLETNLYKERNPEEKIFKKGEGAVLEITTVGFVERLEIIFPEEFLEKNPDVPLVYDYEQPYLQNTETMKFKIPLGIPEQTYEITVKAYKNGEMLISKQTLVVVEGNVLDELRTRILNNG